MLGAVKKAFGGGWRAGSGIQKLKAGHLYFTVPPRNPYQGKNKILAWAWRRGEMAALREKQKGALCKSKRLQ